MSVSNKFEKIYSQNKKSKQKFNETEKCPMIKINEKKPEIQSARERSLPAIRKRSMTSKRKGCKSTQPEEKHRTKRDLEKIKKLRDSGNPIKLKRHEKRKDSGNTTKLKYPNHEDSKQKQETAENSRTESERSRNNEARHEKSGNPWNQMYSDAEEIGKLRDSGSPAKLKDPGHLKLQQATADSSRSGTGRQKKNESAHGNTDSAWNYDIMSDVMERRKRTQLEMMIYPRSHADNTNRKEERTRNAGNAPNPRHSIPASGGSTRKTVNNWETKNLEKYTERKRNSKLIMERGSKYGGSE